jgi:predicted NUDIX family NTP pyrophosphohydrolase
MAQLISAGLVMCRFDQEREFFLVHPGGPFFKKKLQGVWSIPKGLPEAGEELLSAAIREFEEETGIVPSGPFHSLGSIRQKAGKIVHAWAFEGSWDPASGIASNNFKIEWPPRSGKFAEFPEQDKAEWMNLEKAKEAIIPEQIPLLEKASAFYDSVRK